jgi:nitrite reductase/ring-hydroxylating ferredoxin subunit
MNKATVLCRLDDIAEPGSMGFSLGSGAERREILVVRDGGGGLRAYQNSCPHTGGMLDWVPDHFLDIERKYILCATHGALFRIGDGLCIHGPCIGKSLVSVVIKLEGESIILVD